MVILNSSTDSLNSSFPTSSLDALHLWKRFKKTKPDDTKVEKDKEKPLKQLVNIKKRTGSDYMCKRTVTQEKLFRQNCENQYRNSSHESSLSIDSSYNSSTDRKRIYLSDDYHDNENEGCVNMTGILHLRKPLVANTDTCEEYYQARGRMDPANWRSVTGNIVNQQEKREKMNKPELQKETIKTIAKSKPQVSDEFSNFVENSVSNTAAYNIQGNVENNVTVIHCPIFKVQQLINKKPLETIRIPASVRTSFRKSSHNFHLLNRIDTFRVPAPVAKRNYKSAETTRQDKECNNIRIAVENGNSQVNQLKNQNEVFVSGVESKLNENSECNKLKPDRKSFNNDVQPRTAYNNSAENINWPEQTNRFNKHIKSEAQNGTLQRRKLLKEDNGYSDVVGPVQDGYSQCKPKEDRFSNNKNQRFEYVKMEKEGTDNLVQNKHNESEVQRRNETKDYYSTHYCDDDMITYVNSLTDEENAAKRESRKKGMAYDDDLFAFVPNSPESGSQISSSPAPSARKINPHNFPFDRIKAVCREKQKANKTMDSDDSFNVSSDLESLSVSTVSMHRRYEALRKKMNKINSPCNENETSCILPDENDDRKVLENKNQLLNRCLRASHDYLKMHNNNVVEITKVKCRPKPEPLLKPISTRYFAKSSTNNSDNEKKNNAVEENIEVEKEEHMAFSTICNPNTKILSSTPIKNLQKEKDEKSNVDFLNKSNRDTDNIFSSAATSFEDVDSTVDDNSGLYSSKLDSDTDNEKYCDVATKHEEFIESTNISKNVKSDIQSQTQHSAKSSKDMEKCDRKTEMMKNNKIKASSDSENDIMESEYIIDYDAFDIENIELFFPALTKVENLKKAICSKIISENEVSTVNEDLNNSKIESLESDFEISSNNYSSANASMSSNLNSDSGTPSSSTSLFNFNRNIFENVNIKLSELRTNGLDYDDSQTKETKFNDQKVSSKNKNVELHLYPLSSIDKTTQQIPSDEKVELNMCSKNSKIVSSEKLCHQKMTDKDNIEQNLNNNDDVTLLQHVEKPKSSNENIVTAPKQVSKKMQKYRLALENYKHKCKSEVDTKDENKNVQQSNNSSQNENLHAQKSLQHPILKEIQKRKLHLTLKPFV